jgi:hypothetical protein
MRSCRARAGERSQRALREAVSNGDHDRCGNFRRRWQCGHRHQTTDAAAVDTSIAVAAVVRRGGLARQVMVADHAEWIGRRLGRSAGGAEACQQTRQRDRVSSRQRDDAPLPRLPARMLVHCRSPIRAPID